MSIKLIATDLDGTFFDTDHTTIPERNIEAFKKAHEMGVKTAVASGRTRCLTDGVLRQLPFLDYLITSNGAVTYDLNKNEIVSSKLMDNKQTLEIFKILDGYDLPYEIYCNGGCYIGEQGLKKYGSAHIPEHFMRILKDHLTIVPTLAGFIGSCGIEKINVMSLTPEQRAELEEKIRKTGEIYITSSIPQNMEMNHPNANKGFALKALAESMGVGGDSVMCFGDGENDMSMLSFADYSFAMENGSEQAKKAARFIAGKNFECGVAKAIEKYVLGERNEF